MSEVVKSCWLVILPSCSFFMVGEKCSQAEALAHARGIWPAAEVR